MDQGPCGNRSPPTLLFESQPLGVAFHPSQNIVATGLIDGHVHCYRYTPEGNNCLWTVKPHKKSCRVVEFNHDGTALFSASSDKSLLAIDGATGKVMMKKAGAHSAPISAMLRLNETLLMTGDDDGVIKGWDIRTGQEVIEYNESEDYISDMTYDEPSKTLLATSADGCLAAFDVRRPKPVALSECQDDELLSVVVLKHGKKVAVGTQGGMIHIFNFGSWGDCTDRFIGHPTSIETMVKATEDMIITGSSDGMIRVCQIQQNALLGIVGEHEDFPVEQIRLSHDMAYLASCSHDDTVRLWDMEAVFGESEGEEGEECDTTKAREDDGSVAMDAGDSDGERTGGKKAKAKIKRKGQRRAAAAASFFEDL